MTKDELIESLQALANLSGDDPETAHAEADDLLIEFINDAEIKAAYDSIVKWYA